MEIVNDVFCKAKNSIVILSKDAENYVEYTPYGETWVEKRAADTNALPYKFTGKEFDEETGLYYYGARYLDPKTSRWLSTDPALGEYIPQAPVNDEAKKANGNLPGMGGIYNQVNFHLYHYASNNPVKYVDPDGRVIVRQLSLESMSNHTGKLPNSGEEVSKFGCVVATISNMFNALSDSLVSSISSIIEHSANTDKYPKNDFFDATGGLFAGVTATAFGFSYSEKLASNTDLVEAFNELSESTTNFAVGATVKWGESSDGHTVGVNGMAEFNGKAYFEVAPSSNNDVKGGTNRNNWIKENGKLYVPVSDVIKLRYTWKDE